jgi:hypothetical protein
VFMKTHHSAQAGRSPRLCGPSAVNADLT